MLVKVASRKKNPGERDSRDTPEKYGMAGAAGWRASLDRWSRAPHGQVTVFSSQRKSTRTLI